MVSEIKKAKPTSAGRRFRSWVSRDELYSGSPYAPLLERKKQRSGRNNQGRITSRHRGGGHKKHYRVIDFHRNKDGIKAVVERLEYDPNRSAHIALLLYRDGERRYIISPEGTKVGDILEYAWESGIDMLDTASSYGNSEEVLGEFIGKYREMDWKIITKVPDLWPFL